LLDGRCESHPRSAAWPRSGPPPAGPSRCGQLHVDAFACLAIVWPRRRLCHASGVSSTYGGRPRDQIAVNLLTWPSTSSSRMVGRRMLHRFVVGLLRQMNGLKTSVTGSSGGQRPAGCQRRTRYRNAATVPVSPDALSTAGSAPASARRDIGLLARVRTGAKTANSTSKQGAEERRLLLSVRRAKLPPSEQQQPNARDSRISQRVAAGSPRTLKRMK